MKRTHTPSTPSDQEIESIVAEAIAAEASAALREAAPPSSAIVWWRAQLRARQEAANAVDRPLTVVHAVAIACGTGLLFSILGTAIAGVKGSLGWVSAIVTAAGTSASGVSMDLTSRWVLLPVGAMVVSAIVASVTALVIYADE